MGRTEKTWIKWGETLNSQLGKGKKTTVAGKGTQRMVVVGSLGKGVENSPHRIEIGFAAQEKRIKT